jgi:predicted nucleic acid-binding protein
LIALYDTNVVLDVLWPRPEFLGNSSAALNLVATGEIEGYLAAHAITTIDYLARRSPSYSRASIASLLRHLKIAAVDQAVIQEALASPMKDFEDAVTHAAAYAVGANFIVTRNTKDFSGSTVPALEPALFLTTLRNAGP